jgi:hypothetical protein
VLASAQFVQGLEYWVVNANVGFVHVCCFGQLNKCSISLSFFKYFPSFPVLIMPMVSDIALYICPVCGLSIRNCYCYFL